MKGKNMAQAKAAVFFDLSNINRSFDKIKEKKGLPEQTRINFEKIVNLVTIGMEVISKNIYLIEPINNNIDKFEAFIKSLEFSGFRVTKKPTKRIITAMDGVIHKGNFDVEITRDICKLIFTKTPCDEFVLFSGDSDFACLDEDIKEYGSRLTVVSALGNISSDLSKVAYRVILLNDLDENIYIL